MTRTGLIWDERYFWYFSGALSGPTGASPWMEPIDNLESPEGKRRILNLLNRSGLANQLEMIAPRMADDETLCRAHTPAHVERLRTLAENGGYIYTRSHSMLLSRGGFDTLALAAGGVVTAVDAVLDGQVDNAYALVRPPGHHAEPEEAMGFCFLANAAIAGLHGLEARGLSRIAYVDWDVHHGNGTQAVFYADPRALTISIHQAPGFPRGTGTVAETGTGAGLGCNLNVPLPPGCGGGVYARVLEQIVAPALRRFRPELIIIPCGFDAGGHDPLGRMMLNSEDFRWMTRFMMDLAGELCGGRLVMCHEGGYAPHVVPFFAHAVFEALSGRTTDVEDPFLAAMSGPHQSAVGADQQRAIDAAAANLQGVPAG